MIEFHLDFQMTAAENTNLRKAKRKVLAILE